jgi:LacI family transcriptional regulator
MEVKRVTLRDIARVSGVHLATVSRALRKDSQVGEQTTREVCRIAEEMGYKPDPMLAALSAYRSQTKKPAYHATISWITNDYTRHGWNNCTTFDLYFKGARERAAQMGYQLEEFWLREPGITPKRASSILKHRGISGLIIAPQPKPKMRVRLNFDDFSAIALGFTTAWPTLNIVTNHHFHAMSMVVRHIRAHGYRRIGLSVNLGHDGRSNHAWTGAFLALQQLWPAKQRIPLLPAEGGTRAKLEEWLKKYRPDVVVSYDAMALQLAELGYRIPQDIGFATYMGSPEYANRTLAGIDENAYQTGFAAVNQLVAMMHRGERGVPKVPQCLLVDASWREGETLRFQNRLKAPVESQTANF